MRTKIYVVSHGWHTGLVLPAHKIKKSLPQLGERFPDAVYLEFGWGDRDFYQAEEMTMELALKAVLWPTESAMHVISLPANIERLYEGSEMFEICLSHREYSSLIKFISGSFNKNKKSEIFDLGHGIDADSRFYKGAGKYFLINTCNSWTAKGLRSAGFHILYAKNLTAGSVMDYLRVHRKAIRVTSKKKSAALPGSDSTCP